MAADDNGEASGRLSASPESAVIYCPEAGIG